MEGPFKKEEPSVFAPLKKVIGIVIALLVVIGGGILLLKHAAPGLYTKTMSKIDQIRGWDEDARRKDPVGYLKFAKQRMLEQKDTLNRLVRGLSGNRQAMQKLALDTEMKVTQAKGFLDQMKKAYNEAAAKPNGYPLSFAGATYREESTFKNQMMLTFQEWKAHEQTLAEARKAQDAIDQKLIALQQKEIALNSALAQIDPKIAIAEANAATADVASTMDLVQQAMLNTEETIDAAEASPIRSIDDLMKSEQRAQPTPVDKDFANFLESQ